MEKTGQNVLWSREKKIYILLNPLVFMEMYGGSIMKIMDERNLMPQESAVNANCNSHEFFFLFLELKSLHSFNNGTTQLISFSRLTENRFKLGNGLGLILRDSFLDFSERHADIRPFVVTSLSPPRMSSTRLSFHLRC